MDEVARLPDMVPSAYLRVFQPLDTFGAEEQAHWERYLLQGSRSPAIRARYRDRVHANGLGVITPADGEHADVRVVDGRTFVSPWRIRLRVLAGMLAFRDSAPIEGLTDGFVPKSDARKAGRELARMRRRDPGAISFVHQSPWHVPIRWFVLFDDAERRLKEDEHGRLRLRYRTTLRRAMRRAEDAVPALRRADLGPISDYILDLHQWMALFDHQSILELDYASLSDLMTWDELDDDRSVRDIHEALTALQRYYYTPAADIYQGVLGRWAEIRSREVLN
jgi:hypothetical protein